jgi:hypothetical protein
MAQPDIAQGARRLGTAGDFPCFVQGGDDRLFEARPFCGADQASQSFSRQQYQVIKLSSRELLQPGDDRPLIGGIKDGDQRTADRGGSPGFQHLCKEVKFAGLGDGDGTAAQRFRAHSSPSRWHSAITLSGFPPQCNHRGLDKGKDFLEKYVVDESNN